MVEWYLFLPQVRLSVADITERARHAEASGFDGIAFVDHLEAPGLSDESIWEAMGIATWVAAKTERLRIGHLVLCDAFRHPAVLAKQAVTLSAASERQIRARPRRGILARGVHQIRCRSTGSGCPGRATRTPPGLDHAVLGRRDRRRAPVRCRARTSDTAGSWRHRAPDDGTRSQLCGLVEPAGEPPRSVARAGPGSGKGPALSSADGGLRPVGQRSGPGARGEHPTIRQPGVGAGVR